jgi:hypothetical protein
MSLCSTELIVWMLQRQVIQVGGFRDMRWRSCGTMHGRIVEYRAKVVNRTRESRARPLVWAWRALEIGKIHGTRLFDPRIQLRIAHHTPHNISPALFKFRSLHHLDSSLCVCFTSKHVVRRSNTDHCGVAGR